ncbi:MAG TPA: acylphosphatase [Dehalococcoidia bacterium]|jgi:acylphosphatase|nr:acylphosphatase [Dehalococcoidia bacterium]
MTETAGERQGLHAVVYGRVQAVGFREFVRRNAESLGLSGWVRNLPDGRSVEVQANGDRRRLELLLERLRQGPRLAQVTRLEHEWTAASGSEAAFEVR